jgi:hypothetical protein
MSLFRSFSHLRQSLTHILNSLYFIGWIHLGFCKLCRSIQILTNKKSVLESILLMILSFFFSFCYHHWGIEHAAKPPYFRISFQRKIKSNGSVWLIQFIKMFNCYSNVTHLFKTLSGTSYDFTVFRSYLQVPMHLIQKRWTIHRKSWCNDRLGVIVEKSNPKLSLIICTYRLTWTQFLNSLSFAVGIRLQYLHCWYNFLI